MVAGARKYPSERYPSRAVRSTSPFHDALWVSAGSSLAKQRVPFSTV
jgi:hypothetical protein